MYALLLISSLSVVDGEVRQADRPVSFVRDVVPALTQAGCRGGKCHGSPRHQQNGGFRLSLFGSRPLQDYVAIVDGPRGPLIDENIAEDSRLLRMAFGERSHPGSKPLERSSSVYGVLKQWITQGAQPPQARFDRFDLRIAPRYATLQPGQAIEFRVCTVDSDKRQRDVTKLCRFRVEHRDGTQWKREDEGRFQIAGHGHFQIVAQFGSRSVVAAVDVPYANEAAAFRWSDNDPVDRILSRRWKRMGLQPAEAADEAVLVRRLYLHLIGRRPTYREVLTFVDSNHTDKLRRLVDELLAHPEYAPHWADEWERWLTIPEGRLSAKEHRALMNWLRNMLAENTSAFEIAQSLIAPLGTSADDGSVGFPLAWKTDRERTEATARAFLGVNARCFRCHDDPRFGRRVDDYHALVACFAGESVTRTQDRREIVFRRTRYRHPDTAAVLPPAAFGVAIAETPQDTRLAFAQWMEHDKRNRFARTIVNRYWKALYSEPLVESRNDSVRPNPSPHADVLKTLAIDFVRHKYDIKFLLRRLCSTRIYRLGTRMSNKTAMSWRGEFIRRLPQRLPPRIFVRQLAIATGVDLKEIEREFDSVKQQGIWREEPPLIGFQPDRCDLTSNPNLRSALVLLNSSFLSDLITHPKGRAARLAASEQTDAAILNELFQVTLSRLPTEIELTKCLEHLTKTKQKNAGSRRNAVEDILWALINTKEFLFNA